MGSTRLALVIHEPGFRPWYVAVHRIPFVLSNDLPADARLRGTKAPVRIAIGRDEGGYHARNLGRRDPEGRNRAFRLRHRSVIVAAGVRIRFVAEAEEEPQRAPLRRLEPSPAPADAESPPPDSGALAPPPTRTFREAAPPIAPRARTAASRTGTSGRDEAVNGIRELVQKAKILQDGLRHTLESLDDHPVFHARGRVRAGNRRRDPAP